jgi:hypothetical protein
MGLVYSPGQRLLGRYKGNEEMKKLVITIIPGAIALALVLWLVAKLFGLVELSPFWEIILVFFAVLNLLLFLLRIIKG